MADNKGFVIPAGVIEKLRTRVRMDSERELRDFVTDALNTYVALGGLVTGGGILQVRNPQDETVRRVRLPFELRSVAARPEPAGETAAADA